MVRPDGAEADGRVCFHFALGPEMSDPVQDAGAAPEGSAGANRVILAAEGFAGDAVNLGKNFEWRFVLRRRGLDDIGGRSGQVAELDQGFCAEQMKESDECAVPSCCGAGDCSVTGSARLNPPLLSNQ